MYIESAAVCTLSRRRVRSLRNIPYQMEKEMRTKLIKPRLLPSP